MPQNKGVFSSPLTVTKIGERTWRVEHAFTYTTSDNDVISVPAGFETDFASVPRGLWNLFPPDGNYTQAAVVHDYLYNQKGQGRKRSRCDWTFLDAMKTLNVPKRQRWPIYLAVRGFGWEFW